jgi:hypothetical protein
MKVQYSTPQKEQHNLTISMFELDFTTFQATRDGDSKTL